MTTERNDLAVKIGRKLLLIELKKKKATVVQII